MNSGDNNLAKKTIAVIVTTSQKSKPIFIAALD